MQSALLPENEFRNIVKIDFYVLSS